MNRGRLVISYRGLEEILKLPEGSCIQWTEDEFDRAHLVVYVDHPDIPKVKPGQLFPEVVLKTKDGEEYEWQESGKQKALA
jgi:hypothetical protein